MSIETQQDLQGLRRAGRVVARALDAMRAALRPGITTAELDDIAERVLDDHGARSAPRLVYGFPGATCISVNDEAVHGVPGPRTVREGDLVTLDATVELDGYFADAAITVAVPPAAPVAIRLIATAEAAFRKAAALVRAGRRLTEVGAAVEAQVRRGGFRVLRDLCGHGIGRSIHESPEVPNHAVPGLRDRLENGMVIALEPIISETADHSRVDPDGWTIRSADGSLTAHYEHTLVVTPSRPLVLTLP
ncbi:MAG TPA: type I methionyl aminopeptidase [Longimicrobiales bacterium]